MNSAEERTELTMDDTQRNRFLTVCIEGISYAVEVSSVQEIVEPQPLAPLPDAPEFIKGVINLRGQVIPVVDLSARLNKRVAKCGGRASIVIVNIRNKLTGFFVDAVSEVLLIEPKNIIPIPETLTRLYGHAVKAVGKTESELTLLLDSDLLAG